MKASRRVAKEVPVIVVVPPNVLPPSRARAEEGADERDAALAAR
jgi:hypothetical protein